MHPAAVLLALAASASAYQVTQPNGSQGWTNVGPQPVAWNRVDTDPLNFTIVLTNQNRALFPQDQVLVAQQDGVGADTVNCNPPSAGWVVGEHYRINLVKSSDDQSTIYAQSNEFALEPPNSTTTTSGSLSIRPAPTSLVSPPASIASSSSPTTPTSGSNAPPDPNGAAAIKASSGLMAILGAITLFAA